MHGGADLKARVGDRELDGLDLLRFDDQGKVAELVVMVRPMSGLNALAEAMGREFERLGITPPAGGWSAPMRQPAGALARVPPVGCRSVRDQTDPAMEAPGWR